MFDELRKFSAGKFPGLRQWIMLLIGVSWMTSWLQIWAQDTDPGHLPDLTSFFIGRPLMQFAALTIGVWLWSKALRIQWKEAIATGWQWMLGLLALPSIFNILLRALGLSLTSWPYVSGREWLLTLVTGGWFPRPFASPGVLLTILVLGWVIGWTVWHWREEKTRAILTGLATVFVYLLFLSIPSFLGWFGAEQETSWWLTSGYAVQRNLVLLLNQQYWWQSLYDRFPGAVGGEVQVSEAFLYVVLAYLFIVTVVGILFRENIRAGLVSIPRIRAFFGSKEGFLTSLLIFGAFLGIDQIVGFRFGFVEILAFLVAMIVVVLSSAFFESTTLFSQDERLLLQILLFIGAWLLGWPVFTAFFLFFLLRQYLRAEAPHSWLQDGAREAIIATLIFLAAFAFGSRQGSFEVIGARSLLGFWVFFLGQELTHASLSDTIDRGTVSPSWLQRRLGIGGARSLVILLSYGILPLLTGWFSWSLLALPVGCIAALLVFRPSPLAKKHLFQLATAFFLVSYFFLSVRGFHS